MSKASFRFILAACCFALTSVILVQLWPNGANAKNESPLSPRSAEEQRIIDVYKRVNTAVVFISTVTLSRDPFYSVPQEGSGSGIIVDAAQGIILTNLHVIRDANKIEILLADGNSYKARPVGFDEQYDLAVLQLLSPPTSLVGFEFGDSAKVEVGQKVLAIGNPHGLDRTLTMGIVSSLNRTVKNPNGFLMKGLVQTDAAINPGNSGGPLIDLSGRLIGMNTAILSKSGDSAGIGFAVPINQIRRVLPELIATGKVLRPEVGWILLDTDRGPMVFRVQTGSPAEKAGVQAIERTVGTAFLRGVVRDFSRADVILEVNGQPVYTRDDVYEVVNSSKRGSSLTFTLQRGADPRAIRKVTLKPVLR